jgi:hypothetical protein
MATCALQNILPVGREPLIFDHDQPQGPLGKFQKFNFQDMAFILKLYYNYSKTINQYLISDVQQT